MYRLASKRFLHNIRLQIAPFLHQEHMSSPMQNNKRRCKREVSASTRAGQNQDTFAGLEQAFDTICQDLKSYDEKREIVIQRSREIQKLSKQAIFSIHRSNISEADDRLHKAKSVYHELSPLIEEQPSLRSGSFSNSLEEYCEAVIFRQYVKDSTMMVPEDLPMVNTEEYLGGLLDFTGELNRWAIARATQRDVAAVQHARDCVDSIMGCFLRLDLRNGQIRKKYDALKYTLKKLENTLYELSLGGHKDFDPIQGDDEGNE